MTPLFGWIRNDNEVAKVIDTLIYKSASNLIKDNNLDILSDNVHGDEPCLLYKYTRKVTNNNDMPSGPQGIGDCVSWGWGGANNYVAALQVYSQLNKLGLINLIKNDGSLVNGVQDHPNYLQLVNKLEEYQETCTEWIYGSSRVEIGKQNGSYEDGSVGAWAAKAVSTIGTLSRKLLGPYSKERAKDWGAKGVPDDQESLAKEHLIKSVVPVTSYNEARTMIRSFKPVPVCSDRGFTMTRDSKGRCRPQGRWDHCMLFIAEAENMLLCAQSWGPNTPDGPIYLEQPSNTFWVEADVADYMLKQNDSFAPSDFDAYQIEDFISWKH